MNNPDDMTLEELERMWWAIAQEIDRRGGKVDSYAAPHVWNLVAKILREEFPAGREHDSVILTKRGTIVDLALDFAKRFAEDDGFDPIAWLDKCSPDPETYPFSEHWDEPDPNEIETWT